MQSNYQANYNSGAILARFDRRPWLIRRTPHKSTPVVGAIADIVRLRDKGKTLMMAIKAATAERGFQMSRQTVDNLVKRARQAETA
jgi:hypothetical protein